MTLERSLNNNFKVQDFTEAVIQIPNTWGTISQLGIFTPEPVMTSIVGFEEIVEGNGKLIDRVRGERNTVNRGDVRKVHQFSIPHFPLDDQILPKDLIANSRYNSRTEAERLQDVRDRKMRYIRRKHASTLEVARAQLLTAGTVYAPSGTVAQNWFTEFGVTQTSIDFVLGTGATDVRGKFEQAIAAIQDNAGLVDMTGIVCLASPEWFAKFINHQAITTAYQYFAGTNQNGNPLRDRVGGGATVMHREFIYMGVRIIEMRDTIDGTRLIPANTAVFVPTGTDAFRTYFAPCETRMSTINTLGEEMYWFEKDMDDKGIVIETESNFANGCLRPALIIAATTSN
jgi:hypothetical protein